MKFRNLLMCLLAGLVILGYPNMNTYAAENTAVTTDGIVAVNTDVIINNTTDAAALPQTSTEATVDETTGSDTTIEDESEVEDTIEVDEEDSLDTSDSEVVKDTQTADKKVVKKIKYKKSELRLLSALIYCEAGGESYQGKLAVGIVVMNRKRSGAYPDTVKDVIYQRYQFGPVTNGALSDALAQYDKGNFTSDNEKECVKAAKAALSGTKSIKVNGKSKDFSKYLSFSCYLNNYTYQLGNHKFK